ncbi:ATP-binding protein [Methanocella sp. CWC-04]|uniref:ATP-binding protein n=1 Tax=Methanooceanicella nereidis TaxID=2052831 RepID=A0AAP2W7V3_9EURY|nr:ATP-grasp domain-containing protein [Methanocella sp. CWC-04]MCD1295619.1 ATP-binding protein [Methanocella sp. CWC-04]
MVKSVLVLGYSSRYIACSARRAGYRVYSVSHYDDLDLEKCTESGARFDDMPENIVPWLERYKVDHVVLGSGFEDARIDSSIVLGNDPDVSRKVLNKVWLANKLKEMGIRQPRIFTRDNVEYPCVAKPIRGGGGHKNFLVTDASMLPPEDEYFLQEFIRGKPLSVSVLSSEDDAVPVALNEILVGKKWLGQDLEFGYCGNVTPYQSRYKEEMFETSKKLIKALKLVGSNGVDFMVNENGPYVLEINPRFQGSLDSVELATGENLFQAHVDAINGDLREFGIKRYGYKGIFFARRTTRVTGNMLRPMIADVPRVGSVFEKGEAIVTVMGKGDKRSSAVGMVRDNLKFVKANLKVSRN